MSQQVIPVEIKDSEPLHIRKGYDSVEVGTPGRIRTCAPGSGGRCSIP